MLSTHDLACLRGDRRLFRDLSISLAPGRLLRVEGANGSGKTSLLRLLAGLALPAAGEVRWQGRPIRRQREAYAQALVYLGHLGGLKDELTPLENLRIEADLCGLPAPAPALQAALDHWGLTRQAALPLRVLSAGQKRRAALARLNLATAPLWILDEPFNALDVDAVAALGRQIEGHLARGGLAVVTSHMALPIAPAQMQSVRLA
ncbi:MAG: cytochrome c biogenesis heme-transporting ATPase CcmA [Proteobacteria bacterium]|nr:cytochrome c biogenesis heme-transporting ATPase CcmA [Pseudomonadota bacterium]